MTATGLSKRCVDLRVDVCLGARKVSSLNAAVKSSAWLSLVAPGTERMQCHRVPPVECGRKLSQCLGTFPSFRLARFEKLRGLGLLWRCGIAVTSRGGWRWSEGRPVRLMQLLDVRRIGERKYDWLKECFRVLGSGSLGVDGDRGDVDA